MHSFNARTMYSSIFSRPGVFFSTPVPMSKSVCCTEALYDTGTQAGEEEEEDERRRKVSA